MGHCSGDAVTLSSRDKGERDRLANFLGWLADKDARLNGVELTNFPAMGWGVRATRDLKVRNNTEQVVQTVLAVISGCSEF